MISERDIAEKFSVIWKQHFPLLTPNFIKIFNETQIHKINTIHVPINDNVRFDLVSEAAFNLSEKLAVLEISAQEYLLNKENINALIKETANQIWGIFNLDDAIEINTSELKEIELISDNICEFVRKIKTDIVSFRPKMRGYGFIPDLQADLSIDNTLYEIKTVNRNFKSADFKQLFIYLALQQASGDLKWRHAGLYNPRRGTYCKFNIKNFIYNLTGGNSVNEAFDNLLNSLTRDVQIDSTF